MKIGEIWKLKTSVEQVPLAPIKQGKMIGLDSSHEADDFIFLPVKVEIISLTDPEPNPIEVVESPRKLNEEMEHEVTYNFSHQEFTSCYKKEYEVK